MPSSYTPSLRLVLPAAGENIGTWGDLVNNGLTSLVEAAIAGSVTVNVPDANVTLTAANEAPDQARAMFVNITGTVTGARTVFCPAQSKLYVVHNGIAGSIIFAATGGAGVILPAGARALLYCNGVNVIVADGTLFGTQLKNAVDAPAARTLLGADIYKTVPRNNTGLVSGEVFATGSGITLNTGRPVGETYSVLNVGGIPFTVTQGVGLTLRLGGTTTTGNRTLAAWGMASIYVDTSTNYIITGAGVS